MAQTAAERVKETCLGSDEDQQVQLDTLLGEIHHNLGCVGTETNEPEKTLRHFQQFKDIISRQQENDQEHHKLPLSIAWNELGNAWMLNGEWTKGEDCFKNSIQIAKAVDAEDATNRSFPMVNLGLALWMTHRYDEAAQVILEGLRDRELSFGKDDRESFM